jgi:hypothetical protein
MVPIEGAALVAKGAAMPPVGGAVAAARPSVLIATSEGKAGADWASAVAPTSFFFVVFHQASDGIDLQPIALTPTIAARPAVKTVLRLAVLRMASVP